MFTLVLIAGLGSWKNFNQPIFCCTSAWRF